VQGKLRHKKLKSATIIETVIALLILMISFSAGMVIYNRIIASGVNDLEMKAGLEAEFIADSLGMTGNREDMEIVRPEYTCQVRYSSSEGYPSLIRMSVTALDANHKVVAADIRLIAKDEKRED